MGGVIGLLAVIFAFVFPIAMYGIWTSHKKEMLALNKQLTESDRLNMENELVAVKKRLEVLEAIVTDKAYQLNAEIAELKVVDNDKQA